MIKNLRKQLVPIQQLALFLSYPLHVLAVVGWFVIPFANGFLRELLAFLILTLVSIAITVLAPTARLKLWVAVVAASLLTLLCFVKLSFYLNFGAKLSASALFIIFETNASEATDFLASYLTGSVVAVLSLLLALLCLSFIQLLRFPFTTFRTTTFIRVFSIVGVIVSLMAIQSRFSEENLLVKSADAYAEYTQALANRSAELAQHLSPNIAVTSSAQEQQTYVVVIGESTTRWHMQLYGYERETNPLLMDMRDELHIYNDVISPAASTMSALDKILTKSDIDAPYTKNNASVVQLANAAGFETYWISNQQPVGIHDAYASLIGNAASEQFFVAVDGYEYDIHDEQLLPVLDQVLAKEPQKKMIFLHLIGTHGSYKRRYPGTFDYFKTPRADALVKSDRALDIINQYDNSVRYNDFIVAEIINRVKAAGSNSYVVYFSDHGDDVFDTDQEFVGGHNEFKPTKPMYDIPFLVWFSDEYKRQYPGTVAVDNIDSPYILEDFMHAFADVSQISFDAFDAEKSIFSTHFKAKTRRVINGEIYDNK